METKGKEPGPYAQYVAAKDSQPELFEVGQHGIAKWVTQASVRDYLFGRAGCFIYFLMANNTCVYVGKSDSDFRSRLKSHCNDKVFDDVFLLAVNPELVLVVERFWIRTIRPRYNSTSFKTPLPKRERGRPRKPPEKKRTEVLYLKLTPAEKELIDSAAEEPSVWARQVVLRAAKRAKSRPEPGQPR